MQEIVAFVEVKGHTRSTEVKQKKSRKHDFPTRHRSLCQIHEKYIVVHRNHNAFMCSGLIWAYIFE